MIITYWEKKGRHYIDRATFTTCTKQATVYNVGFISAASYIYN